MKRTGFISLLAASFSALVLFAASCAGGGDISDDYYYDFNEASEILAYELLDSYYEGLSEEEYGRGEKKRLAVLDEWSEELVAHITARIVDLGTGEIRGIGRVMYVIEEDADADAGSRQDSY